MWGKLYPQIMHAENDLHRFNSDSRICLIHALVAEEIGIAVAVLETLDH